MHVQPDIHTHVRSGVLKAYSEIFKIFIDHDYAVFANRVGDGGCEVSFVKMLPKTSIQKITQKSIETVPNKISSSVDSDSAYNVLMNKDNSLNYDKTVAKVEEFGIKSAADLSYIDKEHIIELTNLLKVVPKKKVLHMLQQPSAH